MFKWINLLISLIITYIHTMMFKGIKHKCKSLHFKTNDIVHTY